MSPLFRFSAISSGGRCAWVRASPWGFASVLLLLLPRSALSRWRLGGSGAAPLTVEGAAASACPPAGACLCGFGRACRSTMAAGLPSSRSARGGFSLGCMDARRARCPALPSPPLVVRPDELGAGGWAFVFGASLGRGVSLLGLTPTPRRYSVGLAPCVALGGVRRVPRALPLPPSLRLPAPSPAVLGLFSAAVRPVVLGLFLAAGRPVALGGGGGL